MSEAPERGADAYGSAGTRSGTGAGSAGFREAIVAYIRSQAKPPDKFSHQGRFYELTRRLGQGARYDDDVVFAAAWLHDLGVFVGHRPEEPEALSAWDHVAYACEKTPALLRGFGFPEEKIPAVLEAIRTHLPSANPTSFESVLLRDADLLEQLGAVGIMRTVSKVGRDTRFRGFAAALEVIRGNSERLPGLLRLPAALELSQSRLRLARSFLEAAAAEAGKVDW